VALELRKRPRRCWKHDFEADRRSRGTVSQHADSCWIGGRVPLSEVIPLVVHPEDSKTSETEEVLKNPFRSWSEVVQPRSLLSLNPINGEIHRLEERLAGSCLCSSHS
jgi:hypothetical protein